MAMGFWVNCSKVMVERVLENRWKQDRQSERGREREMDIYDEETEGKWREADGRS
jgi:hypothetical protein